MMGWVQWMAAHKAKDKWETRKEQQIDSGKHTMTLHEQSSLKNYEI